LPESGPVDDRGLKWRRRPLRRVGLLDVVHEVDGDGLRGSRVEGREDSWVTVGVDACGLLEPGVASEPHHPIAALVHAAILGSERWVLHPILKAADALVVALFDL